MSWVTLRAYVSDVLYTLLALVLLAIVAVSVALCRSVYRHALLTYAMRLNTAARRLRRAHGVFARSMAAEEAVARALREAGWRHVFLRRRVAVARVGHNREVDVVAVGPVVLVVEVKHWQGSVWCNGPRWFQQSSARRVLEFEDVYEDNVVKAAALRRYLENTCRIALPDWQLAQGGGGDKDSRAGAGATAAAAAGKPSGTWYTDGALHKYCGACIVPVVVFSNRRVRLDPATVRQKRHVYTFDTFRAFAAAVMRDGYVAAPEPVTTVAVTHRRRAASRHAAAATHHNTAAATAAAAAAAAANTTTTTNTMVAPPTRLWRALTLLWRRVRGTARDGDDDGDGNGGDGGDKAGATYTGTEPVRLDGALQETIAQAVRVLRTWDVVYTHDGRLITGDLQSLEAPSVGCVYARRQLLDMHIRGGRTGVAGMAQLLLSNSAGYVELVLTPAEQYKQRQRQEQRQRRLQLSSSSSSSSSSARATYAITCDVDGRVAFAIAPLHRRLEQTDRLTMKAAGTAKLLVVPLIDVRAVELSQHHHAAEQQLLAHA